MKNFTGVKSLLLLTCCMGLKLIAQNPLQYQINQQGNGNCAGSPVELSVATAVRLSTTLAGSITANAAVSGGTVLNDGGKPVTQRGVCWNTSPNPTTANFSSSDGNGLGNFTSNLSGLTPNTTYYVRAYAINSAGTFYGNEISFITISVGSIASLNCTGANNTGNLTQGTAASNVSSSISYTGGNGGIYSGQTITSTGVTGLTATLTAGSFASGSGSLTYTITGTPASSGTTSFALNIGGKSCILTRTVDASIGFISALNCSTISSAGILIEGENSVDASSSISYSGGNGGAYNGQSVSSTGVTGLTAILPAGSFTNGSGTLTYYITGIPASSGLARFALNIGGQSYSLARIVNNSDEVEASQHTCGASGIHNVAKVYGTMNDQDGNMYKTIVIGTQEWMAENLRTTTYSNGDPIPNVTDANEWFQLSAGAWCYYNNDSQFECPYGKMYNWHTVSDSRNICPIGWHVPTDSEWNTLIGFFDPSFNPNALGIQGQTAGGKLKSTSGWNTPNVGATNTSGFSGIAGGARGTSNGCFNNIGSFGSWWSSTPNDNITARYRYLNTADNYAYRLSSNKLNAFSVRCVKD